MLQLNQKIFGMLQLLLFHYHLDQMDLQYNLLKLLIH